MAGVSAQESLDGAGGATWIAYNRAIAARSVIVFHRRVHGHQSTSEVPSFSVDRVDLGGVAPEFGLRLIVLYGSYAKQRADAESDLDVAVLGCPSSKFWACYEKLSETFPQYSLDMVRLEDADALLRYEIMQDGILLYGDPDLYCEYRAFAYRDYVDSSDLFALEEALFRKKMARIKEQLYGSP